MVGLFDRASKRSAAAREPFVTVRGWLARREIEPSVRHRLPGRIRFEIPALTRVEARLRPEIESRLHRAGLPAGYTRLTVTLATGSIRIEYDPDRVGEAEIRRWLDGLVDRTRSVIEAHAAMPSSRRSRSLEALTAELDRALDGGQPLAPELVEATRVSAT